MNTLGAASLTRRTDMSDFTLPAREGQPFLRLATAICYVAGIMSRFIKAASPKDSVTLSCGFSMGRGALCRG